MPDDVKISEMSEAASLDNSAQFPYVQSMNGNLTTLKAPLTQISTKINESMTFSNLQTTSKTIVGAINEAAQGGGVEYATELPISSTDPTDTKSYIDTKTTLVKSASGSLIHITDGGDNIPMKSLESEIVAVESGSGEKSPTNPYSISGFANGVITRCGKNFYQSGSVTEEFNGAFWSLGGTLGSNVPDGSLVFNAGTYTLSDFPTKEIRRFDETGARVDTAIGTMTFTLTKREKVRFAIVTNSQAYNVQIEVGDTATTYEAYNGNDYTFAFGQTVYGGHFDNKGNLVVTHGKFKISDLTWTRTTSYANPFFYSLISDGLKNTLAISDKLNCISPTYSEDFASVSNNHDFCIGSYSPQIFIRADEYTDATTFSSAGGMGNTEIVYELATPITLAITSQDIPTISGVNNIFSNCGDTAIEYFTSSADEVANLVRAEGTYFHKYSTSEHVVGVWIDNKTLYEKTVVIEGSNLTAGQSNTIAHGISNIDFIQITEGSFIFGNGTVKMPLPFADEYKPITNSLVVIEGITDTAIKIGVGSNYINNASPVRAWITLQYTKTT